MAKQQKKQLGMFLIILSFISILIIIIWLAAYWPVYYDPASRVILKQGIILWTEPYSDWSEPNWFFSWWLWVIPIILAIAGILLRGEFKFSSFLDFLIEIAYFVAGIFASALVLLSLLPQIHWYWWARLRFAAYGIILLGFIYYFKQKYSAKARFTNKIKK